MKTNTQNIPSANTVLLEWTAPTHPTHVRTWRWYAIAGTVVALLLVFSAWTGAWSFALVTVILSAVLLFSQHRGPANKIIQIYENGFRIDRQFTPWGQCTGFWLLQGQDYVELHIERAQKYNNHVRILTGSVDYRDVYTVLANFIPLLEERQESVLDNFARSLKI